jgi:hypothetical protein
MVLLGMAAVGCQKEVLEPVVAEDATAITQPAFTKAITVEDGSLVFENEEHLNATLEQLSLMQPQERVAFEDDLGFRSLGSIYHLVTEAETQHQDAFFKDLDPDLGVADCERLGYFYKPTSIYADYLKKGVIEEITYADRSRAFALTIDNPAYENVLNERGEVIVGDRLLVFEGATYQEFMRGSHALVPQSGSQKITVNGEYDFTIRAHRPGYETASGSVVWLQDPARGSNYRYYARVTFRSGYTTSTISQTFFWDAKAQQRRFGNWATRSSYNPIWGISGSWRYDYWIIYNNASYGVVRDGAQYPLPNMTPRPTSPYYLSGLNTNHTVRYLYPHGFFARSSTIGWNFFENLRLYNYAFTISFSGGSSGYGYQAY